MARRLRYAIAEAEPTTASSNGLLVILPAYGLFTANIRAGEELVLDENEPEI